MQRFLLICCLLASFACTKDLTQVPSGDKTDSEAPVLGSPSVAAKGTLAVKLTSAAAAAVLEKQTRSDGVATRTGIGGIDAVLEETGVTRFERLWAYDPAWEARYDKTGINRWYVVYFDENADVEKIGKLLAKQSGIAAVELPTAAKYRRVMSEGPAKPYFIESDPNVGVTTRAAATMNDPFLSKQWHYDNPGVGNMARAGADIDLTDAWSLCKGNSNIVVAVIDEPVYTEHPDLKANIWSNPDNPSEHGYNFYNQSATLDWKSNYYDSEYREWMYADHGSHVAGVIAAVNNNGVGGGGVAGGDNGNGVKIMSCQILGYNDRNIDTYSDSKAFEYALKNGAVIAQNSWGYNVSSSFPPSSMERLWNSGSDGSLVSLKDAIDTFVEFAGTDDPSSPIQGGLVIFAAGNDGDVWRDAKIYPAAYAPVIAVGSMDWGFLPAFYTDYGSWVEITAPGGDMLVDSNSGGVFSTILCDDSMNYRDSRKGSASYGYGFMQGTSMACPHVSGVAALGLSYAAQLGKKYTAEEFTALLLSSVYGIDRNFEGTKDIGSVQLRMANYKNKMGGGCTDALKLLLAIKGTPAVYAGTEGTATVDLARYFGGSDSSVTLSGVTIASADMTELGMTSTPVVSGSKISVACTKPGAVFITVGARAGDTTVSREFALVVRAGLAGNGGWL